MHGRPCASAGTCEYDQLPLVEDAEIRDQPEEAEIKKKKAWNNTKQLGKGKESTQVQVHIERRGKWPCTISIVDDTDAPKFGFIQRATDWIHMVEGSQGKGREGRLSSSRY